MKTTSTISLFFLVAVIVGIAALFGVGREFITGSGDPMDALIERLAYAYRPPVRFGGEIILYHPKEDSSIRPLIRSKGRSIVPYLVKGLTHRNRRIRYECAELLGDIPAKEGIEGLIKAMGNSGPCIVPTAPLHESLHRLTGHDKPIGPVSATNPDITLMRAIWLPWWEKYKDRLVDTDGGIGIKGDDGTIIPLPLPKQTTPSGDSFPAPQPPSPVTTNAGRDEKK